MLFDCSDCGCCCWRYHQHVSDSRLFLRTVLGACIGTGLATWLLELSRDRKMDESVRCVVSAGLGELLGVTTKVTVGIIIWLLVAITAFWP